ncbi:MAG: ROK family protein [Acidobacteria bacterium]|nr:ROK family protein [Acidobacteriota bacterium]
MKALAIDLGGSHATCAIVQDRAILASEVVPADAAENLSALLARAAQTFAQLGKKESLALRDCAGIAIGFPGLVSMRETRVVSTNAKYEDAPRLNLAQWGRETLGLPLRIENDARLALLGEAFAGAAQGFTDVIMMTLGTGIGGVAMIEGKLLRGKHSQAGCLGGHIPVLYTGRDCTCGGKGCAEAEASGWSLPLVFRDWPGGERSGLAKYPSIGFKELFAEADAGDEVAQKIRDRCLQIWCADAVGMVHAYDPEILLIGGGVMKRAADIVPVIQAHLNRYAWTPWGKVQVRPALLGNHAALLGAVPLLTETLSA